MSVFRDAPAFAAAARLGFKQTLREPVALLGNFLTYATLVVAYAGVFKAIAAADLAPFGLTPPDLTWWLGVTEFVLFCSTSFHFRELQEDIKSGQIELALTRPCPVWVVRVGDNAGQYVARMLLLMTPCFALTSAMAGDLRLGVGQALGLIVSTLLAGTMLVCSYFMAGASCLWVKQSEPVFWIWQKCLFVLGALLWPLALYPLALAGFAWLTPFPAVLAAPAQWAQAASAFGLAAATLHQIFWTGMFILAAARVNRAMLGALQKGGPL